MEIRDIKFKELNELCGQGKEGVVFYCLAETPEEIPAVVHKFWAGAECFTRECIPEEVFSHSLRLSRPAKDDKTGEEFVAHDIALVFRSDAPIAMGRLAMVKLQGPAASWVSDYVPNMRKNFIGSEANLAALQKKENPVVDVDEEPEDDEPQVEFETRTITLIKKEYQEVDVEVPKGLEGYEVAEYLHETTRGEGILSEHFRYRGHTEILCVDNAKQQDDEEYQIHELS